MRSIIVADDSCLARSFIIKLIRLAGVENTDIHEAGNGREVLDLARNGTPQVILTDLTMPEMNGIELVREITRDASIDIAPNQIILITSSGSTEERRELRKLGIEQILTKPVDQQQMSRALSAIPGLSLLKKESGYGY
ncbi:MAG: response regulator [Fibrobacterota bacterium]